MRAQLTLKRKHCIISKTKKDWKTSPFCFAVKTVRNYSCSHLMTCDIVPSSKEVFCSAFISEHLPFSITTVVFVTTGVSPGKVCVVVQ